MPTPSATLISEPRVDAPTPWSSAFARGRRRRGADALRAGLGRLGALGRRSVGLRRQLRRERRPARRPTSTPSCLSIFASSLSQSRSAISSPSPCVRPYRSIFLYRFDRGMSSARAVSDTFQSNSRSFASKNARSAACLNSSNVLQSSSEPRPACSGSRGRRAARRRRRDARARRQNEQTLDRVAQLAHVARPLELRQSLDGLRRDRARRHALAIRQHVDEVRDERRNVLAPLAQRRHVDRHDVQPIEQILAKAPFGDLRLEILVRRREHAHVDLDRLRCRRSASRRRPAARAAPWPAR